MAIHYILQILRDNIGTLDSDTVDSETLGFHKLTEAEHFDMINYDSSGNIEVKSICENCHESFLKIR